MVQETGETRDAIIEADERHIEAILSENTSRKEKYWIVVFAKPAKVAVDGKPTLMKHIRAYAMRPSAQVGMIVGEVDNAKGTISWDVNMPQKPFDFDALTVLGAKPCDEMVIETTSIPHAYVTK